MTKELEFLHPQVSPLIDPLHQSLLAEALGCPHVCLVQVNCLFCRFYSSTIASFWVRPRWYFISVVFIIVVVVGLFKVLSFVRYWFVPLFFGLVFCCV
jgi:hypothetical protein